MADHTQRKKLFGTEPPVRSTRPAAAGKGERTTKELTRSVDASERVVVSKAACFILIFCLVCLVFWLNEINQMNQINQIDQMNQIILPQPVRAAA